MNLLSLIAVPIVAFAIAWASVPAAGRIARWLGITAEPVRVSGAAKIPVFGGASIVAALLAALALFDALPEWLLFGTGAMFALGLVDDAIALRPRRKLCLQAGVVLAALLVMPRIALTPWPLLDQALIAFWLLATTNAFNLIDGLDGLAAGVGAIAGLAIAATALWAGDLRLALMALAVTGALGGFLVHNFHPATIFMGDGGALPIGFALGGLALIGGQLPGNSRLTEYAYPVLVMLVPILDTAIVSVTRLATGRAISRRGLDHSHHRLLSLGLSDRKAASVCWLVAGLGAVCAVAASVLPHADVLMGLPLIALVVAVLALFMMDLTFESRSPAQSYGYLGGVARFILDMGYKRRLAEAAVDSTLIASAYFGAFMLRLNFAITDDLASGIAWCVPWLLLVTYPAFVATGIYRGVWRYTALSDGIRFANGAVLAGTLMVVGGLVFPISYSRSIVVLYVVLLFNLLVATRLSFQVLRKGIAFLSQASKRVLVVGADRTGSAAADYILAHQAEGLRLVGFVDDDAFMRGKLVHGQEVLGSIDDLERLYDATRFDQILVATDGVNGPRLAQVSAFAERRGIPIRRFTIQVGDFPAGHELPMSEPARFAFGDPRRIG